MKTVTVTELRSHVSDMLSKVEQGETIVVMRHGRAIAEVTPISHGAATTPSWKSPGLRLFTKGAALSSAVLEGRE